jgi:hypothetical protein
MVTFPVTPNFNSGQNQFASALCYGINNLGPVEEPIPVKYGNKFNFKISNKSPHPLPYDLRFISNQSYYAPPAGTVAPGQSTEILFILTCQTIECADAAVLSLGDQTAHLWFWSTPKGLEHAQCINILAKTNFTITMDENYQNNGYCPTFSLGVGGGGDTLCTNNICLEVS